MNMNDDFEKQIDNWIETGKLNNSVFKLLENRDIFQDTLMQLTEVFLQNKNCLTEDDVYILSAIIGEIGNNSFDHNLGSWPKVRGTILGYVSKNSFVKIVLADQGQGILDTLKKVKPELKNDKEALKVAFTEIVSGRAPESRGNGLKFVKQSIKSKKMHLTFISGQAQVDINQKMRIKENKKHIAGCVAIITMNCKKNEN